VVAFAVAGYWYVRFWGRFVRSIFNPEGQQPAPFWTRFRQELSELDRSERTAIAILVGLLALSLIWAALQAST
jgi:hypothetical protein